MLIKDENAKVKWMCMYLCMNMGYLASLAQFNSKLLKMEACINDDKARPRHRELRSLLLARSVWVR